jgi:hypothetical protein
VAPAPLAAALVAAAVLELAALRASVAAEALGPSASSSAMPAAAAVTPAVALAVAELARHRVALGLRRRGRLSAAEETLEPTEEALGSGRRSRLGGGRREALVAPGVLVAGLAPERVAALVASIGLGR